jgi:hypothetical protein
VEVLGAKDAAPKLGEKPVERARDGSKVRRRPPPAEIWKTLRSSNPLWDPKVTYKAIGKNRGAEWDDVGLCTTNLRGVNLLIDYPRFSWFRH